MNNKTYKAVPLQLLNGGIAIFSLEIISPMWYNDN